MNQSNQETKQNQSQTADQNFANGTLFMALSTMETLEQKFRNQRKPKFFGAYDQFDYWHKSIPELVDQQITHVQLLRYSVQMFYQQYGTGSYRLPDNYDFEAVRARVESSEQFFKMLSKYANHCLALAGDIKDIMYCQYDDLNCDKIKIQTEAEPQSSQEFANNLIGGITMMQEEEKRILEKGEDFKPSDLQMKLNEDWVEDQKENKDLPKNKHEDSE